MKHLPWWIDFIVIPAITLTLALGLTAGLIAALGDNPCEALSILLEGALGSKEGIGYTLYYATDFIFTAMAVAYAFQARLFNIGGEGQAYLGGLGVALVLLSLDAYLPFWALFPLSILGAMAFGALWALIPAYLQAYRQSHIVITTIMFNFIAASLMVYLMVHYLKQPGQASLISRDFAPEALLPTMAQFLGYFGIHWPETTWNISFLLAIAALGLMYWLIYKTAWGYELRVSGYNPEAAKTAGIPAQKMTISVMLISGAMAGLMGVNEIQGVSHHLVLGFTAGFGFTGIAIALMGRNHPLGILIASIIFGALYQGGGELSFEMDQYSRDLIVVIQGIIIILAAGLDFVIRRQLTAWLAKEVRL